MALAAQAGNDNYEYKAVYIAYLFVVMLRMGRLIILSKD
jgi:hypothetical protein